MLLNQTKHCSCQLYQTSEKMSRHMTKPTKWPVRTAKTRISLGIRPVWSEPSLSTWRNLGSLAIHWAHSKDSDQTGRMPRLIWVFAGCTGHFVGFVVLRLKSIISICINSYLIYRHVEIMFTNMTTSEDCWGGVILRIDKITTSVYNSSL